MEEGLWPGKDRGADAEGLESLKQDLGNCGLWPKSGPVPVFVWPVSYEGFLPFSVIGEYPKKNNVKDIGEI